MEKNITLRELAKIFQSKIIKQFKIKRFIVNYHNKVIGIQLKILKEEQKIIHFIFLVIVLQYQGI